MAQRRHVFLVSLTLVLVSATYAAGGHASQATAAAAITGQQGTDGGVAGSMTRSSKIGSSPPKCEGKCGWWCVGRSCKAVLVPIEPPLQEQDKKQISRRHGGSDGPRAASAAAQPSPYQDADHTSPIYQAVVWRCKCVGAS